MFRSCVEMNETVDMSLEQWMTQLPEPMKQIPIINLAIPGISKLQVTNSKQNFMFFSNKQLI